MRTIRYIVVHHSVTPQYQEVHKALGSFDRTHKDRLGSIGQPVSTGDYPNVAYHFVIGGNGDVVEARNLEDYGYHASNYKVNRESIGICMLGNFDNDTPSSDQLSSLRALIKSLKDRFPIEEVTGHRDHTNTKSCPGINCTDTMFKNMEPELSEWQRNAVRWAVRNKVSNGERPLDQLTRVEAFELFRKFTDFISKQ